MTARDDILGKHRATIIDILPRHGATSISLVGSVARREDSDESDYDFVVEFTPSASLMDHAHLELDLEALLGRHVDVVNAAAPSQYLAGMLKEAVPL